MYHFGVSTATTILSTWTEMVATTLYSVQRVIFYGAPPSMNLCCVANRCTDIGRQRWPVYPRLDLDSDIAANYAMSNTTLNINDWVITPQSPNAPPPSYAHAVARAIDLVSSDDDAAGDDIQDMEAAFFGLTTVEMRKLAYQLALWIPDLSVYSMS